MLVYFYHSTGKEGRRGEEREKEGGEKKRGKKKEEERRRKKKKEEERRGEGMEGPPSTLKPLCNLVLALQQRQLTSFAPCNSSSCFDNGEESVRESW